MPEWYRKLLEFLSSFNIDPSSSVSTLSLMAANGDGKLIALCDFLEPKEEAPDHSWEHVASIISGTKPLNEMSPENMEKLHGLVERNDLMLVDASSKGKRAKKVNVGADGNYSLGEEQNVSAQVSDDQQWMFKEYNGIKEFYTQGMEKTYIRDIYGKETLDLVSKYGLKPMLKVFFADNEIDPRSMEELPFLQGVESTEEKSRLLQDYFTELMKNPENYLSAEERAFLENEEISAKELRVLAYNQGISVQSYMNRLRGIEDVAIDYGAGGKAPSGNKKSEEEILDAGVKEVNEKLLASANNIFDKSMAQTMIELKEASFNVAANAEKMEKLFAKFVTLKAAANFFAINYGDTIPEDSQEMPFFQKALDSEPKNTEALCKDETFKYFIKKLGKDRLSELCRGTDMKPLDEAYNSFMRASKEKILDDPLHKLDYMLLKSKDTNVKALYFPDKVIGNSWRTAPNNPFSLSADRSAVVTFAFGKALEKGYNIRDLLDPEKLQQERIAVGKEAYEQFQIDSPENRRNLVNAYMTAYEQCVKLSDELLMQADSLKPAGILATGCADKFYALGIVMKDAYQELEKLSQQEPFPEETAKKFKTLVERGEANNYLFNAAKKGAEAVLHLGLNEKTEATPAVNSLCVLEASDKLFHTVKTNARKKNMSVSEYLVADIAKNNGAPNALSTKIISAGTVISPVVSSREYNAQFNVIDASKKNQRTIAADFMNGTFGKKVNIKQGDNNNVQMDLKKYLGTFRKEPSAPENQAPVMS